MNPKGTVLDIQRFALHDGPGIRTAVFLKGCSLRCAWCCNPESQSIRPQLGYAAEKCVLCPSCAKACPSGVFSHGSDNRLHIDFSACTLCGRCVDECPHGALRIFGTVSSADSVMAEVLKDRSYYENSGGGISLSGGEPTCQLSFAVELLQRSRREGLHTCIETSGYAPRSTFEALLPLVDLFLFDYKLTGNALHKKFAGVEQDAILANLDFLCGQKASILLRCPIIPGLNDTREHFEAIVRLSCQYLAFKGIELMPYHDFGVSKHRQIGYPDYPITAATVSPDQKSRWQQQLIDMGRQNLVL
ncbi:MAG: glycyl-radical enzyme activating protein [Limisphaerales bacterium]